MKFEYKKTSENSDATSNYDIVGEYPVSFREFFEWILQNDMSFRIKFGASNECFGGWLGNHFEVERVCGIPCVTTQDPPKWFDEIADMKVTECWANGGYGQMSYICTFDEESKKFNHRKKRKNRSIGWFIKSRTRK